MKKGSCLWHEPFFIWWTRPGSNRWPLHCERNALPAELRAHLFDCLNLFVTKNGHFGNKFSTAPHLVVEAHVC